MKTLHELVKEELAKRLDGPVNLADPAQHVEMVRRTEERNTQAAARLAQDPALAELIGFSSQIISIVSQLPAVQFAKDVAITTALVKAVEMWENANNRFNVQLAPQERPQQQ